MNKEKHDHNATFLIAVIFMLCITHQVLSISAKNDFSPDSLPPWEQLRALLTAVLGWPRKTP